MSASYTRQDRVLSVREREKLRREINERERSLEGHIVVPHVPGAGPEGMSERRLGRWEGFIDKNVREDPRLLQSQIRNLKRVLDQGNPRNLSRREKQMLERQVAEDREYFKRNMVPSKTYFQKSVVDGRANPEFDSASKAVFDKEVGNKEFQKRANRFINNMRELDPENPDSANMEKFRPK
jgi:hypothetical protein